MELQEVAPSSQHVSINVESEGLQSNAVEGNNQLKVALKDFIILVQSVREEYWLKGSLGNPDKTDFHVIWKDILEGRHDSVHTWLRDVKTKNGDIDETDCNGLNALHYSILFRQPLLVKLLVEGGAGLTTPATGIKFLPLQLAIVGAEPFTEAIDLLCPKEDEGNPTDEAEDAFYSFYSKKDVVNYCLEDSNLGTALDLAIHIRSEKAVKVLVDKGADPTHCWKNRTCLEKAIEIREKNIVSILLGMEDEVSKMAALKRVQRCRSKFSPEKHGHNSFNDLIDAYPDFTETVMDHCIHTKHVPHEKDYEISFDCSLFENERSNSNKCYRGLPCTCCCDFIGHNTKSHRDENDGGLNFSRRFYDSFEKDQHPLHHIMETDEFQLLQHPLVQALLNVKLSIFFWMLYLLNFTIYLALVSFLIIFILHVPNPRSTACLNFFNSSTGQDSDAELCASVLTPVRSRVLLSFQILTLILVLFRALCEAYQLYHQKILHYIFSWENWLEIAQCISTTIFLFRVDRDECFCATTLEWEAGIVSLALSCLVLILWTETMPLIGIYVIILKKIVNSFLKVALFGILLIVAFGLSFYMLFYTPSTDNSGTFSSPVRAILSIIPLTAGDISIDSVFYSELRSNYETLAFVIWLSSVIIMSILFNNLLVGLAVGEVSEVINEARMTEIKKKINLVLTLEENLPERIHRRIIRTTPIIVHPNISKVKTFFKGILATCCLGFSLVCFNLNHMRFWYWFVYQPPKQKKHLQAVASIVEKTRLHKFDKKSTNTTATTDEVAQQMTELCYELL